MRDLPQALKTRQPAFEPLPESDLFAFWEAGWRRRFSAYSDAYRMACERNVRYPFHEELILSDYRLHCAVARKTSELEQDVNRRSQH